MVNSMSDNETGYSQLRSANKLSPKKLLRYKNADVMTSEKSESYTFKRDISKSSIKMKTTTDKLNIQKNEILPEDNVLQLRELKLNIKRIDETNYVSILSSRSLKMLEEASPSKKILSEDSSTTPKKQTSKTSVSSTPDHSKNVINSMEPVASKCAKKLINGFGDSVDVNEVENEIDFLNTPSKRTLRTSVSTTPVNSKNIIDSLESVTSKRSRKPINRFGDSIDMNEFENEIDFSKTPPKRTRKTSVSTTPGNSKNMIDSLETVTPKRSRKLINRFGDSVYENEEENEIDFLNTPPKRTRRTSVSTTPGNSKNIFDSLESVPPKRLRKPINRFGNSIDVNEIENELDFSNTPPKRTRRTSVSTTPGNSRNIIDSLESVTPKRSRKLIDQFQDSLDDIEIDHTNSPKYKRRTSVSSTPGKANNTLESITPKRTRKLVSRFGDTVDSNEIEITKTPKSNKNGRQSSKYDDIDFEIDVWKTPVNKHLRRSMTPTTHSGSKVRRSILQGIPENKEIEVISTPKTPKKTPKAHIKNLIASASKRSDSGARVPCSPLEKARASLHLHAAPKHLPCRETEFKSVHSFLARKINDELTGSMYISGVPGTGKTATVKRVIDSLNADIIMKHSFKFIEINGLRLANPHQAFSVIWKELTAETVTSSRAQALLNDYFSGEEVREKSTILLVDEVDHICNRKQDVVYNILDWPSRIGSKVVVITIANTMDLPERVLRGCVTSRMGLTRLVFKPYTFQQLQEIIMNRLTGNSSFDPDAVQLVARKVAAVSGDARRALDICRRAIDLINSEDDTQLITISHVNQVLNSILSGVRVTAIRNCSLLEQFFLRALRDETTRTGFDHSSIDSIYIQMKNICLLEGEELPNDQQVIMLAYRLRNSGLIFLENKRWDIFRKVSLNVSPEDISYALDKYNNN